MKYFATAISTIFHPLFILTYVLILLMLINPYLFSFHEIKAKGLIVISTFMLSAFFPLIAITMMKALGLIKSLQMKDKMERVGPLIATSIFYLWLYLNIKDNTMIPGAFSFFVLGSTIALFLSFFLNIFHKVSLHAVGAGGMLIGMILIGSNFSYGSFVIDVPVLGSYQISIMALYIVLLLVAGITLTARLLLKAHKKDELYGGFFIGAISQILAFITFF